MPLTIDEAKLRVERLINKALGTQAVEEARTAALEAVRLIAKHEIKLVSTVQAEMLAWLEAQNEPSPADRVEPPQPPAVGGGGGGPHPAWRQVVERAATKGAEKLAGELVDRLFRRKR